MTTDIHEIKRVLKTTLAECLPLFKIHSNVESVVRKKMLEIINKNREIGKLKNVETIVFTLMIYAIQQLKIPLNKNQINEQIQQYIKQKNVLKDLSHLKI
tara:strand:+ start:57 stop:356 length:300 start_codon:yes stop_codon:yes gene_type:complete